MRWYLYTPQGQLVKSWPATGDKMSPQQGGRMTITNFARLVCQKEGLKVQISIAQVMEVLKIVNGLLGGLLYRWIRKMEV